MSFTLVKAGGWAFGEILTSDQMEALDEDHANAVDGVGGGTYAPASALVFGGAGLQVTGTFAVSGTTTFSGGVTFTNDITFVNDIVLGDTPSDSIDVGGTATFAVVATFEDGIDVTGDLTLAGNLEQTGNQTITGNVNVTGTLETTGDLTVGDDLTVDDDAVIQGDLTVNGNSTIGSSDSDSLTLNARLANRLRFTGLGRVGMRMLVLDDANQTVGVADGNFFIIPGTLSASRIYELDRANAVNNADFAIFVSATPNDQLGQNVTIRDETTNLGVAFDDTDNDPLAIFAYFDDEWRLVYRAILG